MLRLAVLLLAIPLHACGWASSTAEPIPGEPTAEPATERTGTPAEPTAKPTAPVVHPPPTEPKPSVATPPQNPALIEPIAYFAVDGKGITHLDSTGTFTLIEDSPDTIRELLIGPDDRAYALTYEGVAVFNGDTFTKVLEFDWDAFGEVETLAFTRDGGFLATSSTGLAEVHIDDWAVTETKAIDPNILVLLGAAIDRNGHVWTLSRERIHHRDAAGQWTTLDPMLHARMHVFTRFVQTPSGELFAAADHSLVQLDGSEPFGQTESPDEADPTLETIDLAVPPQFGAIHAIAVASTGHIAIADASCNVARFDPAAPEQLWTRNGRKAWGCESFAAIGVDARDRVWVGSKIGVHIVGPTDELVALTRGSIPELDGDIVGLAVLGDGPRVY